MSIELEDLVPTAAADGRFPPTLTLLVCAAGRVWPIGSVSALTGALVFDLAVRGTPALDDARRRG